MSGTVRRIWLVSRWIVFRRDITEMVNLALKINHLPTNLDTKLAPLLKPLSLLWTLAGCRRLVEGLSKACRRLVEGLSKACRRLVEGLSKAGRRLVEGWSKCVEKPITHTCIYADYFSTVVGSSLWSFFKHSSVQFKFCSVQFPARGYP